MSATRRDVPRGLLAAVAFSLGAWAVALVAPRWLPEPAHPIAWRELGAARLESERTGRPLFVEFTADWCAPCARLDAETLRDPGVAAVVNEQFVPVRLVNASDPAACTPGEAEARAAHGVASFPAVVVVGRDAPEPERLDGFASPRELLRFLEAARLREMAARRSLSARRPPGPSR